MSTLKVNTLEEATSGGATFFTAKSWVNFNGTGTVAIRADGNVSSITDNGTGRYTINTSSALTDGNFSVAGLPGQNSTGQSMHSMEIVSTSSSTALVNTLAESNGVKSWRDTPITTSILVR